MTDDVLDVLVVGAGISGIGAAWHPQTLCPDRRFAIVEARAALGGTWDLFRYPGYVSEAACASACRHRMHRQPS
jgi:monooxygenase